MRIIAGTYRGHRLAAVPTRGVRPTADPVREALFNIVGPRLAGCAFVDLCAGSGAVGLEALSRGAERVWLVDRARSAAGTMQKNLQRLGLEARDGPVHVAVADCGAWIERSAGAALSGWRVSVVFIDPPYGEPRLADWLDRLGGARWVEGDTLIVAEHRRDARVACESLERLWSRRYGDTALTGFQRDNTNESGFS